MLSHPCGPSSGSYGINLKELLKRSDTSSLELELGLNLGTQILGEEKLGGGEGMGAVISNLPTNFFFPLGRHGNRFGTNDSFVLEILLCKYTAQLTKKGFV